MNKFKILLFFLFLLTIVFFICGTVILIYYLRIWWVVLILFFSATLINIIFAFYILQSNKRHTETKMCWLFWLILLPLIGCLFFMIFGTNSFFYRTEKLVSDNDKWFVKHEDYSFSKQIIKSNKPYCNLFRYSFYKSNRPIYQHNDIKIIESNYMLFDSIISLIRSAKKFIHIEIYLIGDGIFLRTLLSELILKAKEGIEVRFLYDWYGSFHKFRNRQVKELKKYNIEVGKFNPKGINMFKGSTNFRLHRKAIIVDNQQAIYGSFNISDEYIKLSKNKNNWKDQNFIVSGEIVNSLNVCFIDDWLYYSKYTISKIAKQNLIKNANKYFKIHKENKNNIMQLSCSSPINNEKNITSILVSLFVNAKKTIKIVTPYFFLTNELLTALLDVVWSGVQVEIIVPGKRDNKNFVVPMNRSNYKLFSQPNCKIYEYDGFIHSKYIIVDEQIVYIGSANLDFRSLWINFENAILINNLDFAKKMNHVFEQNKTESVFFDLGLKKNKLKIKTLLGLKLMNTYRPLL